MWGLLTSAAAWLFNQIFKVGVVKFVIGAAAFFVLEWFWDLLQGLIAPYGASSLSGLNSLPSGALYFMGALQLHIGIPLIMSALVVKFAIRRIPFVG